jgi:hypothetical protein
VNESPEPAPIPAPSPAAPAAPWDRRVVTGLCAALAVLVLAPHLLGRPAAADGGAVFVDYYPKFQRLHPADPVRRDFMATTSSGNFRRLDELIAPEAKLFASGVIGPENGARLGNFFWAIYYFFPRQVDASVNMPPRFTSEGWLDGVDCRSGEELFVRGYDIQLDYGVGQPAEEQMRFVPLRPERALRKTNPSAP